MRSLPFTLFSLSLLLTIAFSINEGSNENPTEANQSQQKKSNAPKSAVYILFGFLILALIFFVYNVIRCQRSGAVMKTPRIERMRIFNDDTQNKSLEEI